MPGLSVKSVEAILKTNNFQVAEIEERLESLENEAKSVQSQVDEVCLIFIICFQISIISLFAK